VSVELKKRVYVPNLGPHDYSKAWDFGDLVFCTEGQVNRKDLRTMLSHMELAMEDAEDRDYILMNGLTSLCVVACSLFVHKFGKLNILMFEDGEYLEKVLTFDNP